MGVANTFLYQLSEGLSAVTRDAIRIHRYDFVAQPVAARPLLPPHRGRNIRTRWLTAYDPKLADGPRSERVLRERFASGSICLLAELDDAFAGFLWLHLRPYADDEVRCVYEPAPASESVWDFDVYVEPRLRSTFTFARLWDEANAYLRERGVRYSFSRISAFNPASLAAHARLGTRRVGRATIVRTWGWQWLFSSTLPFHLSWSDRQVPVLRLHAEPGTRHAPSHVPAIERS